MVKRGMTKQTLSQSVIDNQQDHSNDSSSSPPARELLRSSIVSVYHIPTTSNHNDDNYKQKRVKPNIEDRQQLGPDAMIITDTPMETVRANSSSVDISEGGLSDVDKDEKIIKVEPMSGAATDQKQRHSYLGGLKQGMTPAPTCNNRHNNDFSDADLEVSEPDIDQKDESNDSSKHHEPNSPGKQSPLVTIVESEPSSPCSIDDLDRSSEDEDVKYPSNLKHHRQANSVDPSEDCPHKRHRAHNQQKYHPHHRYDHQQHQRTIIVDDEQQQQQEDNSTESKTPVHLTLKSIEDTSEIQKEKAIELIKIIKDGTFQDLLIMLKRSNLDLNFFIDGQTALHYSLLLGRDLAWCKELVSNGANPNLANRDGWHPIHLAAFRGLSDTMCYLIDFNSRASSLI